MADSETDVTLRNLGPKSIALLQSVGLCTDADIRAIGAAGAYRLVRDVEPAVSLNLLWALAAGLDDRDWRELAEHEKVALRAQID